MGAFDGPGCGEYSCDGPGWGECACDGPGCGESSLVGVLVASGGGGGELGGVTFGVFSSSEPVNEKKSSVVESGN